MYWPHMYTTWSGVSTARDLFGDDIASFHRTPSPIATVVKYTTDNIDDYRIAPVFCQNGEK